ncbi:G-patch domain protein [Penicillium frequentans]|nr:G-patch domain protein [Penicillium glabrum]
MAHPYTDDSRGFNGPPNRSYAGRDDRDERDGRMYDDYSRSRSPGDHSRNRRPEYPNDQDTARQSNREKDWRRSSRSPPRRGRQSYRDRDREGYQSPEYSGNRGISRSRSRHGQSHFGPESREIMLEGFPADMTENDIENELRDAYHIAQLDDIRVIRDRQTKASRQLGFLRFHSILDSKDFLERNHPFVHLYGPTGEKSTKVRIAYSREREDRVRAKAEGDWTCRMCAVVNFSTRAKCFRCNAPRPEIPLASAPGVPPARPVNNGDNDAAPDNQPSQFLLFRGLEPSVTEELLAKGVAKLYRPTSGNDGSSGNQKKGAKVASTTGDANLGAREGSIRRVLLVRDRKTNDSWRYGFAEFANVTDAQAAITRLHSFNKFTISSRPVMVTYIHAGVFVPVLAPSAATKGFTFSPLNNPALKLMYWDDNAYVTELQVSSEEIGSKSEKPTGHQEGSKAIKETEKSKKRKAEAADMEKAKKLAMPSQLQFWSNRHAELHGIPKDDGALPENSLEHGGIPVSEAPPTQSYADPNRNCCYLCMTEFKSAADVNRHERLSQLHRQNLQDEDRKTRAMAKLVKHGILQQSSAEYRDRARERRKTYGPGKAGAQPKPAAPKVEEEPPVQSTSKGASLLSKMGWSEGSGLGAQGTGVTAPIATEVYAQGVGLGAQGGKLGDAAEEAGRNTRGRYDEFLAKTKETARQRYDQMNK